MRYDNSAKYITIYMKGGIIIPNIDFITTLLNVTASDIEKYSIRSDGDTIFYDVTLVRKLFSCPVCGSEMIGHGHKLRKINHPAVREFEGIILHHANRYICKTCRKTLLEPNPFTFEGFNSSYQLLRNVMKKLRDLNYTLQMISEDLGISTTQICRYLDSYITIPPRALPECLGIDELHSPSLSKRNSSYLCILVDNEKRSIYDILDSRSKEQLSLYFSKIPREERKKVKYVTIDMWEPYKDVVSTYLPNAIIAVDPFHVIKHLTHNFSRLRIDFMNQCEYGSNAYYLLKKWHWLLEKDDVNLDNEKVYNSRFKTKLNKRDLFNMIMDAFPLLKQAYDLKEEYRLMNRNSTYEEAVEKFPAITKKFQNSGIRQFDEFTEILVNWQPEILNSFKRPSGDRKLSNAFTENVNSQLRTYLNVSKGVTNFQRFKKRAIYALSQDIYYALSQTLQSESITSKKRGPYNKIKD